MKALTVSLCAALLTGCQVRLSDEPAAPTLSRSADGYSITRTGDSIVRVDMDDGTRCVAVIPERYDAGRALSCDFTKTSVPQPSEP